MQDQDAIVDAKGIHPIILLAEDEVLIRAAASEALREAGFVVIEASNADEALSLVTSGLRPDVLFTDVRMPGRYDGLALARQLNAQLPQLLIVIASGHADPDTAMKLAHRFYTKPYDISAIIEAVTKALAK